MARLGCCDIYYYYHYYSVDVHCLANTCCTQEEFIKKCQVHSYILEYSDLHLVYKYSAVSELDVFVGNDYYVMCGLHPSHSLEKPMFVMFVTLQLRGQCGLGAPAHC